MNIEARVYKARVSSKNKRMNDIEISTGPGCSHCEAATALLNEHIYPFEERDISDHVVMDECKMRLPRARSLPQIFADGEHLGS